MFATTRKAPKKYHNLWPSHKRSNRNQNQSHKKNKNPIFVSRNRAKDSRTIRIPQPRCLPQESAAKIRALRGRDAVDESRRRRTARVRDYVHKTEGKSDSFRGGTRGERWRRAGIGREGEGFEGRAEGFRGRRREEAEGTGGGERKRAEARRGGDGKRWLRGRLRKGAFRSTWRATGSIFAAILHGCPPDLVRAPPAFAVLPLLLLINYLFHFYLFIFFLFCSSFFSFHPKMILISDTDYSRSI